MKARGPVRSVEVLGAVRGVRAVWSVWRRGRAGAGGPARTGSERARVPGAAVGAQAQPGGGLIRFERSSLRVRVAAGGAVFCGWDGAGPEPSYALDGRCPEADARAVLEPDKDGGWRVVSERVMVTVSRHGTVQVGTPGGVVLRREAAPRWWEASHGGGEARWVLRSRVTPDARFYGLGGRSVGPRLPDGTYRLWNTDPEVPFGPGPEALHVTMPVQLVVADVGCHLVFHDSTWDGEVTLREGVEGSGSGHDRDGRCEVRMAGGPLRYWVVTGPPSRVLRGWASLTGTPARPPVWALGYQYAMEDCGDAAAVQRAVAAHREHGVPVQAVYLGRDAGESLRDAAGGDVRLVSAVGPAVAAGPGSELYEEGAAVGAFVRDARGREVRAGGRAGATVFPDFTDPRVRKWWGGRYGELLARGFAGVSHEGNEPAAPAFHRPSSARSARHDLEGRGGDHREAHNVYALAMAKAGYLGLLEQRPDQRPFLLSRSGWAGSQRYGGVSPGETVTGWSGLRASLALVLGLGLCGLPFSGPDVGGSTATPSPELYLRWFQLSAFLPLFRGHRAGRAGAADPWEFGPEVLRHARAAAERRERLLPYFVTLSHLAQRTGAPYVRPLWWHRFQDRALREVDDAFLLGDALLVAPVLEPGVRERQVPLPRGCWYDTATGARHAGGRTVTLEAPPGRLPVLARAGAVIPVAAGGGRLGLEVWSPPPGRSGSGLLVRAHGDGWGRPPVERLTVRVTDGRTDVLTEDGSPVGLPVRVRGEGGPLHGLPQVR